MRVLILITCFFLSSYSHLNAVIHRCESLEEVLPLLNDIHSETLIVFDLDDTLITKTDKILRPAGTLLRTNYYFRLVQKYHFDYILYLISIIENIANPELVDARWPSVIAMLQEKTPFIIAQTAAPPGQLGIFEHFPEARRKLLKKFAIDFSNVSLYYPNVNLLQLNHIPDVLPLFYEGMLFSENYSKGEALLTLLNHYQWYPKKVFYIDDQLNNLRSVEKELKKIHIPMIGIHYEDKVLFEDYVDEAIAEVQYNCLIETKFWLSDEEALKCLQAGEFSKEKPEGPHDFEDQEEDAPDQIWSF